LAPAEAWPAELVGIAQPTMRRALARTPPGPEPGSRSKLIDRYGDGALTEAARMIDRMLADGDDEGRLVWRRIGRAIEAL